MTLEKHKVVCECGWRGTDEELLMGQNPFEPAFTVYGCPQCKEIECFRTACDEPGCWKEDTCGTPTPNGYRRTCYEHCPKEAEGLS